MPARLYFSNSLEILADRLVENLSREGGDPFQAPALATPASSLRDWLKIRIAEKMEITANIAFPHLESLLWDRLAERDRFRDVADRQPARQLDAFDFQGLVLAQLRASPPRELREYLEADSAGGSNEDAARRLCQLSGKLAALFREYEYNRVAEHGFPGVAESWMRGEPCFERHLLRGARAHPARARLREVRALEAWQMEIYRALFREGDGLRDRWGQASGVYRYTLAQYAELALRDPITPPLAEAAPVFHLFGLSNISPFHRDLIGRLADSAKLGEAAVGFEIYALNPCAEFWEDALTPREARARNGAWQPVDAARVRALQLTPEEITEAEVAGGSDENGLLSRFGKPGRETVKLWCQVTDYRFHEGFQEPERDTLLAAVQQSMLHRAGSRDASERLAPDDSVRIRRASDARTEIEAVRAEAFQLLNEHPEIQPEDLAIIPADLEAALPILRNVFAGGGEAPGNVPVLLPPADTREGSPLLRGFGDLLALCEGNADRNAVLGFLENPAVQRKAGVEPGRMPALREFWRAAGFQEGWELTDPGSTMGNETTARDAEERATLAFVLDPADDGLEAAGLWPARATLGRLERAEVAQALEWMERLRACVVPLGEERERPFAEWAGLLRAALDDFLKAGDEDARAEYDLRRFLADLEEWGTWNAALSSGGKADTVPRALIRVLFEDRFRETGAGQGTFLGGGIRIGGLSALRGLPFKHVWITGLSAGAFPASTEASPLDLRGYRRLPGESEPSTRDLYAFLEVIAATSETLSLSWPARGPKGEERQPSRALTGLAAWLESDMLAAPQAPGALAAPARPPYPIPASTPSIAWVQEPKRSGILVEWKDAARYLRNPADQAALGHFRLSPYEALRQEEEGHAAALFLDKRTNSEVLDTMLRAELLAPGSAAHALGEWWKPRSHGGQLPPPPYDRLEAERILRTLEDSVLKQAATLRDCMQEWDLAFAGSLRCGPQGPKTAEPPIITLPAFDLTSLGVSVRLGGILPWFFRGNGPSEGWGILVDEGKEEAAYLLQLCAEAFPSAHLSGPAYLFTRSAKDSGIRGRVLPAFDPSVAPERLRDFMSDFARGPDFSDLPLEAVEKLIANSGTGEDWDWPEAIESWKSEREENAFNRRMKDRILDALKLAVPNDAGEMIERRLLPFLAWKNHGKKPKKNKADDAESGEEEA